MNAAPEGATALDLQPETLAMPATASPAIDAFLRTQLIEQPTLLVDIDLVETAFADLSYGLSDIPLFYAVKANPEIPVLQRLKNLGSNFDVAGLVELELVISLGVHPDRISFGSTIKKNRDIIAAYEAGVRLFAVDAYEEMDKLATHAPGSQVFVRLLTNGSDADWPLSRKFGIDPEEAVELMLYGKSLGLEPVGISFHVGSQARDVAMWHPCLEMARDVWQTATEHGLELSLLNLGGGFPAYYDQDIQNLAAYAKGVRALVDDYFPNNPQRMMAEPGRALVADAGVISAEVVLVSRKRKDDIARWVYLDIGKFSGLAETQGEAIRYRIVSTGRLEETGPCVLAGPSCDSEDVLYEKRPVDLPLDLKCGDRILFHAAGAYTATYASVGFNGIPPLKVICLSAV